MSRPFVDHFVEEHGRDPGTNKWGASLVPEPTRNDPGPPWLPDKVVDEVTDKDKIGDASCLSWLKQQNYNAQKAVLGHHKKVVALRKGHLKESMIATPWKHLEPRFVKKGIKTVDW